MIRSILLTLTLLFLVIGFNLVAQLTEDIAFPLAFFITIGVISSMLFLGFLDDAHF